MINKAYKFAVTALASTTLLAPTAVMAQQCVQEDDLSDAVVYFMPIAFSAFTSKCAAALSEDGFINTQGEAFIAPYLERQDDAWAGAFEVFKVFADKDKSDEKESEPDEMAVLFESMPPEVLRPFLDTIVEMEIAKEIKLDSCVKVERLIEPLAPLPPENLGTLTAVVVSMVPDIKDPQICANDPQ